MSLLPDIEQPRHCPEDGGVMVKEPVLNGEVFIERCPHCKGVFVPPKELEILNNEFTRNRETTYFTMLVASMVSG
jgi:Zn-finger nucleic acid-binding protein